MGSFSEGHRFNVGLPSALGIAVALVAALGCGGQVEASAAGGSATGGDSTSSGGSSGGGGGSGGASGGGGAGGGGGADGGGGWGAELEGHYMQNLIGNCINIEEWLTFTPPGEVVETIVDRDFCQPHSLTSRPGTYGGGGSSQILDLQWAAPGQTAARRFTATVVESYPSLPQPAPEGYELAGGALNAMAYARPGADLTWHRTKRVVYAPDPQGKKYTTLVTIELTFQEELDAMKAPASCSMGVSVDARVWSDEPSDPQSPPDDQGSFTTSLPCSYAMDMSQPWIRLTGDGFEASDTDNSWRDYLDDNYGISMKYSGVVSSMLTEGFRPILYFEPATSRTLFHNASFAWYPRMKNPPPTTVD
jgi:hypothetical protein